MNFIVEKIYYLQSIYIKLKSVQLPSINQICKKVKPIMGETTVNNIKLTRREMSILQEVAIGRTTPQIAQNLGLSPETVKWYRKQLLVKFSAIMNNIL